MATIPRTEGRSVRIAQQPIVQFPGGEGAAAVSNAFANAARLFGGELGYRLRQREQEDIANAAEAGAGDVTLGPDGFPQLNPVDNSTPANRARRARSIGAYESQVEAAWQRQAVDLRGQANDDPEKFRGLFDAAREGALERVHPEMRARGELIWSKLGALHETDMLRARQRQDDANATAALRTGLTMARQRLWDLADLGQREGPMWTEAQANYETALGRLRGARLLNPEQEAQERALAAAEGEARTIAARTVAAARGPQGAAGVPAQFRAPFDAAVQAAGLSPVQANAFAGLVGVESNWNPAARNPASTARGLTQVLRGTAENPGFGIPPVSHDDLDKPEIALLHGARYFKAMLEANGGNVRLALRDYYAGPGQTDAAKLADGERYATRVLARAGVGGAVVDQLDADLTAINIPEDRRNRIIVQARGDLARVDAERRVAVQDVTLQAQELTARLHAGYDIPPDALFDLARRANEMGEPVLSARLARQAEVQGTLVAARRLPLADLQQAASAAAARAGQEGADGTSAVLADGYRKLVEAKARELQQDALSYGTRIHQPVTGALQPIDWSNPDSARAVLSDRVQQARRVAELEGVRVLPLTAGEMQDLKARVSEGDATQRAALLGMLTGLGGRPMLRVLDKLDLGNDRERSFAVAAGVAARGDTRLASEILSGGEVLRNNPITGWQRPEFNAAVDQALGTALTLEGQERVRGAIHLAARDLYAARRFTEGKLNDALDETTLKKAVQDITGGILRFNGGQLIAPAPGMTQDQFDAMIRTVPPERLAGAVNAAGQPFTPAMLLRDGVLRSAGEGRYFIDLKGSGRQVQDRDGRRFELDLRPGS